MPLPLRNHLIELAILQHVRTLGLNLCLGIRLCMGFAVVHPLCKLTLFIFMYNIYIALRYSLPGLRNGYDVSLRQ